LAQLGGQAIPRTKDRTLKWNDLKNASNKDDRGDKSSKSAREPLARLIPVE
jgi:hypothetical protein